MARTIWDCMRPISDCSVLNFRNVFISGLQEHIFSFSNSFFGKLWEGKQKSGCFQSQQERSPQQCIFLMWMHTETHSYQVLCIYVTHKTVPGTSLHLGIQEPETKKDSTPHPHKAARKDIMVAWHQLYLIHEFSWKINKVFVFLFISIGNTC